VHRQRQAWLLLLVFSLARLLHLAQLHSRIRLHQLLWFSVRPLLAL
jgi:hypothetical protein